MFKRKSKETKSCALSSLTLISGLSFHFEIAIIPKSGYFNVAVVFRNTPILG
jgi:hypothetical protein